MLLRDNIYRAIRNSILTCEYGPGQELREQVLADYYHVSRSPIRDSLLRLEQENLVTVLPRQGYRVNPVSITDVEEIYALRQLAEPACAAAAARRDDAVVSELDRFRGFRADSPRDLPFVEYNQAFHEAVADMSDNSRLAALARDLVAQYDRLIRISLNDDHLTTVDQVVREHDALIDAIQAHDADKAALLAYEHAGEARFAILAALAAGGRVPRPEAGVGMPRPNGPASGGPGPHGDYTNGRAGHGPDNGQSAKTNPNGSVNGEAS